jgi:hypothetical protein
MFADPGNGIARNSPHDSRDENSPTCRLKINASTRSFDSAVRVASDPDCSAQDDSGKEMREGAVKILRSVLARMLRKESDTPVTI